MSRLSGKGFAFLRVKSTIFSSNFASGYEREGAALTIYHRGKQVVNIWGGYADRSAGRKWTANTVTPVFSATKVGMVNSSKTISISSFECHFHLS